MDSTSTIGEFLCTLGEMGFSQEQIQAAMQAGHFSVPEAAEWLLQGGGSPRHKLVKPSSQPSGTAFSAFNPPKDARDPCTSDAGPSDGTGPSLVLGAAPASPSKAGPVPPPLETRIKQDRSNFQEQQRQRVAQEARAERRQKKQERELVLKRIAEDRRSQQEKAEATHDPSPSSSQGQRLGGRIQTSVDNQCILMIRLPSGESMRERFPADTPLRNVVEHITGRHPSLPAFSLLQGFPRKRFGEAELACSLRALGLTPNAALCIQTTPPETPLDTPSPTSHPEKPQEEEELLPPLPNIQQQQQHQQDAAAVGMEGVALEEPRALPHHLWEEAVGYAGIPGAGRPLSASSHRWGRGQKLVPGDGEDEERSDDEEQPEEEGVPNPLLNGLPRLPFFPENRFQGGLEPRHHWPDQGNRLREAVADDPADDEEVRVLPGAAGQAAVERLQRAANQEDPHAPQGHPSPPKKPFRAPTVPSLCDMATRATVSLMTAPSMQYSSSLACLTPGLAELLLGHMARERLLRPRTLELFFGCPLQKFVLNCYPYSTNELLRQLRAFTSLKHLSLVNSPLITDAGLSVLSGLVKLQLVNLSSCTKLTDSCLPHLTALKSLSFLALDQTKVSDIGMVAYLQSAPSSLCQLSLNQTAVTETTLAMLPTCVPQLRLLSIKHTKVNDLSALAELCSLHTLYLDGTGVQEDSLQHLATHPNLSALSLAGIPVADGNVALEIISGLRLMQLVLPNRHSVTDSGLAFLSRQVLLTELDLTDYTHVTDQGVAQLASMNRLKKLSLSNTQVTDVGLPPLCSLKELTELCLDRTAITSRGVANLVIHLPHLQVMGLASTQVGDTVVRRGLVHCSQLVKLNLSRTRITDQGLKLLRHMRLNQVNLDGTGVTLAGIANLISGCTHLTSVRASHTRAIPPDQLSDDEDVSNDLRP
ncbi:uncharacterized protein LOC115808026 [Chanos chanos]|uniref:Uncharacterized protein LOC115808026 n=1 Tax=Chanos chanos TaxID=29144 RepID=A0A6J2UYP9_CHACN|nr:uncharacterized protein LOC115808026 [Chanos chanos]